MRSREEVMNYVKVLKTELKTYNTELLDVYIMPDFMSFEVVNNYLKDIPVYAGLQDTFWEDYGSYAGEVAPVMLKNIGCKCVYMGHSERRIYFGETDGNINKKILACYRNGIIPFLFVGETKEELEKGITYEVLEEQLGIGLTGIPAEFMRKMVIMYEPRWAIGQEKSASPEVIKKCHEQVRELIAKMYGIEIAKLTRILYGGSVNLENIAEIIRIPEVDGVGSSRASLIPEDYIKMIRIVEEESGKRRNKIN